MEQIFLLFLFVYCWIAFSWKRKKKEEKNRRRKKKNLFAPKFSYCSIDWECHISICLVKNPFKSLKKKKSFCWRHTVNIFEFRRRRRLFIAAEFETHRIWLLLSADVKTFEMVGEVEEKPKYMVAIIDAYTTIENIYASWKAIARHISIVGAILRVLFFTHRFFFFALSSRVRILGI